MRENRELGFFVAFDFTADAEKEVRRFQLSSGRHIRLLKVSELIEIDHDHAISGKKPVRSAREDFTSANCSTNK